MKAAGNGQRAAPWLTIMTGWLGMREIRGANDNPKIVALFRAAGHPEVTDDETAWCSAAACAAVSAAGYAIPPVSINLMARSWLDHADKLAGPEVGAIAVWKRGTKGWQGHVNVVAEIDWASRTVLCIGGNQGVGEVSYATHRIDSPDLLGWRWPRPAAKTVRAPPAPEAVPAPPAPKPATASDIARVSRKVSLLVRVRALLYGLGGTFGGVFTLENFGIAKGTIDDLKSVAADHAALLTGGAIFIALCAVCYVIRTVVEDYRAGRYVPSREAA